MAFAGLHECWLGADGSEIDTMAIVTPRLLEIVEIDPRLNSVRNEGPDVLRPLAV